MKLKLIDLDIFENLYPEKIFPKITPDEYHQIHKLLKDLIGIPLDRISADIARKIITTMKNITDISTTNIEINDLQYISELIDKLKDLYNCNCTNIEIAITKNEK